MAGRPVCAPKGLSYSSKPWSSPKRRSSSPDKPGAKPRYCDLTDAHGKLVHTAAKAFRARNPRDASTSGGTIVSFQLNPNEYTVAAGDTLELELVGSTAPWFRPSNGTFTMTVTDLHATIGTAEP